LIFYLKLLPFLFIIHLIIKCLFSSVKYVHLITIGIILIISNAALIIYDITALVPLGADMLGYSVSTAFGIVKDSLQFNFQNVILLVVPILLFLALFFWFKKYCISQLYLKITLALGIFLLVFQVSSLQKMAHFKTEYAFNLAQNKMAFFTIKLSDYYYHDEDLQPNFIAKPIYIDQNYPFLKVDEAPDVLGPLLNLDTLKLPDIVIIQVEGLGRAFSGPNAYLGSFTPFIDSLGRESIYFTNFLAAQGRTFAALPSILGSLPFAETGFSDLENQMPKFNSILNIAKANGYKSIYFGGFEMDFDNQGLFMQKAEVNEIISSSDFDKNLKMASPIGYSDGDLFNRVLNHNNVEAPTVKYIQTISMHNPFTVPNQQKYKLMFENRMDELKFNAGQKSQHRSYSNVYESILYTDEALRLFFNSYSKLNKYNNTIFIITGDHRLPEIPLSTKIDRYHVPLIIYSPMLKQTKVIQSISSHLDIAPSINALFKHSYQMKTPSNVTWLGDGLDVCAEFRNVHQYPLKQGKTTMHNFLSGTFFVDEGSLYKIDDKMDLSPAKDNKQLQIINQQFDLYKFKNNTFLKSKMLMP
ncbi:MAG: LTA synthase family protein, partial [Pedobacter sp.]